MKNIKVLFFFLSLWIVVHGHRPLCVPTPQISLFFLSLQNTFLTMYFCLSSQHPDALTFPLSTRQREELLPSSLSFSQCFGGGCINSLLKNICRYALIKLQKFCSVRSGTGPAPHWAWLFKIRVESSRSWTSSDQFTTFYLLAKLRAPNTLLYTFTSVSLSK